MCDCGEHRIGVGRYLGGIEVILPFVLCVLYGGKGIGRERGSCHNFFFGFLDRLDFHNTTVANQTLISLTRPNPMHLIPILKQISPSLLFHPAQSNLKPSQSEQTQLVTPSAQHPRNGRESPGLSTHPSYPRATLRQVM